MKSTKQANLTNPNGAENQKEAKAEKPKVKSSLKMCVFVLRVCVCVRVTVMVVRGSYVVRELFYCLRPQIHIGFIVLCSKCVTGMFK